jgi:hypothetical protein
MLLKLSVYHPPSVSRLNLGKAVYFIIGCGVQESEVYGYSIVDVV